MIDGVGSALSIRRQCELISLHRSSYYRQSDIKGESTATIEIMRRIDELYTAYPYYGSRKISFLLSEEGVVACRKKVQRLMRLMGLESIAPKPNTSKKAKGHKIYPYLLRNMKINRVNQVWSTDITYIRTGKGFCYLVAVIDWHSRAVLSWRLSNTMSSEFCVEALNEALVKFGNPEIFNTDQGSQFTSEKFTSELISRNVKISMDGKGRALDNIFVERLWRSVKYEEIYPKNHETIKEIKDGLAVYFDHYNNDRPHQALNYQRPMRVYLGEADLAKAA